MSAEEKPMTDPLTDLSAVTFGPLVTPQLLGCPFCDGSPEIRVGVGGFGDQRGFVYALECEACNVAMISLDSTVDEARKATVMKWQRAATRSPRGVIL